MRTLHEYVQKRNFKKTPEPGEKKIKKNSAKRLSFVVQEHHASHLHFDFRLEMDGVLKSWAVPKGPSADPHEKRLAVEVEDHPLAYGKFEGRIPEHEYGGGEVIIWDSGFWEPESDYHTGLKKGHLDFTLKGKRMKGRWTLIRTGLRGNKPNWLLFKRNDIYAGKDEHFHAVKNYGSKRDVKRKLTFIEPELPLLVESPPEGNEWIHEIKFDGYRIQAHLQGERVTLYTRSGQDWTKRYPSIVQELAKLKLDDAILDGEIVAINSHGVSDFQALQLAMKSNNPVALQYYVFDLLQKDGEQLNRKPLNDRKKMLKSMLPKKSSPIKLSESIEANGKDMLSASCEQKLEGIVSKLKNSEYRSGRTSDWVKAKCKMRQEFVIGGYSDPQGSRKSFGSLLLGVYREGKLQYVGRCGTGFSTETIRSLFLKMKKRETRVSPFSIKSPKSHDVHWIKPELVAEVSFSNWTVDEILRVPVFHGLRDDKPAKVILRETAKPLPQLLKANAKTKNATILLTHPEKIIYAREKIRKQDIADYYREISSFILPHLSNRPLSLLRCPDGTQKTCFFQKHFTPLQRGGTNHPVVHEILIQEHEGKGAYATIDSTDGLIALVQNGGFELHAWGCRAPDIEHPDQIVIDFDPDPSVSFKNVKDAAFMLKRTLEALNLKSFVKVTGGKGLHVHIPIETIYSWDEVKAFSKTLAQHMEENAKEEFTTVLSKKNRKGKIFVDYLRNGRGQTAVVPYSLRAREKSSVAMPISWNELKTLKDPAQFTLKKAFTHLKKRRSDPWRGITEIRQKIEILHSPRKN